MQLAGFEIPEYEIEISPIRASGPGGQNVNKVSSAIHLRFDIKSSSLPDSCKQRLIAFRDQRISSEAVVVIKAQRFRSQEKNRLEAIERLAELISMANKVAKPRRATRPPKSARLKRLADKKSKSRVKNLRGSTSLQNLD
jgi:ribosome-associated protein